MNKKTLLSALVAIAILLGGWLFYTFTPVALEQSPRLDVTTLKAEGTPPPMEFEGLTFSTYKGKELQARVKIKAMRSAPRKFYIFRIKSINELLMSNVAVEIFQNDQESSIDLLPMAEMQDRVSGTVMAKGMGRITQGHILGFSAIVKEKSGQETLRVEATEATIDFSKHKMTMLNANLVQPRSQRRISSNRIDWDTIERRFIIPGEYRERIGDKVTKGSAVTADTNLVTAKIPQVKKSRN